MSSTKIWILLGCGFIALGAAGWGMFGGGESGEPVVEVPEALTTKAMLNSAENPGAIRETFEALRDEDMTDEQRRQAFKNMRDARRQMMEARMTEYFDASDEERDAVLDAHLDSFMAMMDQMRAAREERRKADGEEERRAEWRQQMGERSQEDRRVQSESRDPDQSAKTMAYFTAMMKRASARGIEMPGRGGGGRGGFGGGRGGGRRGP